MRKFTLYTADCSGNAANCLYPNRTEIENAEELAAAAEMDHTFAEYQNNYRLIDNFMRADVVPMDCDNDNTEEPDEWLTAEKLTEIFNDVDFILYPSRNHMQPKNDRAPRPKYHVLFPIPECTDAAKYSAMKSAIQRRYDFFDDKAVDAARFFYGSSFAPEQVVWHDGELTIDETLRDEDYVQDTEEPAYGIIYEGSRNNVMSLFAGKVLIKYGNCDKALQAFIDRARNCEPPLSEEELRTIWKSALKFAGKIQSTKGYIPPDQYNADFVSLKPADYTDIGEAEAFCKAYGKELAFTEAADFLRYDGTCWCEESQLAIAAAEDFVNMQFIDTKDAVSRAENAIIDLGIDENTVKSRGKELGKLVGAQTQLAALGEADKYLKFVVKYRHYKRIVDVVNTAKPMLKMNIAQFDTNPTLLNTPAGTFDLSKGMNGMQEHRCEDYITKVTNIAPGDTGADIWQEALNTFFTRDQELIDYVQMQVGMALVGQVNDERLIVAYGDGSNGKSTFWNVIFRVLGTYSGKISAEALTTSCKRNIKPEIAELKGKRLVIASEMEEGMRLNTSIVKQLCSTDEIFAEKKYKTPFHFTPSHTLVLYTNHLPKVGANDDGIWRRIAIIPFNAKITGESDVKNYANDLLNNAGPAALKWAIEGAEKAIAADFKVPVPQAVQSAIDTYRESNDWLGQFLEEYCEIGPSLREKSGELYKRYRAICIENGEYSRSTTDFYSALKRAGFERKKITAGKMVIGLKLKDTFLQ